MTTQPMRELVCRAWQLHAAANASLNGIVVRPSLPILYFGDREAYRRSPFKVVTMGLNPSLREFPSGEPWLRFPGGERVNANTPDEYLSLLDGYFREAPYDGWFDRSFEPLLNGMRVTNRKGKQPTVRLDFGVCRDVMPGRFPRRPRRS